MYGDRLSELSIVNVLKNVSTSLLISYGKFFVAVYTSNTLSLIIGSVSIVGTVILFLFYKIRDLRIFIFVTVILFLFQDLSPELEMFNFIVVFLGIILLIVILGYILLTSRQE